FSLLRRLFIYKVENMFSISAVQKYNRFNSNKANLIKYIEGKSILSELSLESKFCHTISISGYQLRQINSDN
ncbi:MAG TPA: hypothetical protein DFI01_06205, partial [Bacteroidales bacterium]|nr:hypothetical protein [Bacteroidales bacterium]